jgi:hypothetical protein
MAFSIAAKEVVDQLAKRLKKGELTAAQVRAFRNHMEGMSPESLISAGFLNPALEPNKKNIKASINRLFKQAEGSPAAMRREKARTFSDVMADYNELDLPDRNIITPEQIADEKRVLVPNISDQSATDRIVTKVGGFDLAEPVTSYGGQDFSRKVTDPAIQQKLADEGILDRLGWASNEGAMRAQQNQFDFVWDKYNDQGYTPLAINTVLNPSATDFAHPIADSLVQVMQQHVKLPQKVAKRFDDDIRAGKRKMEKGNPAVTKTGEPIWDRKPFPEWKGINSPEALEQIRTTDGGKRQSVTSLAFSAPWQAEGFPAQRAFLEAFNIPEMPRGSAGYSFYSPVRGASVDPIPDWLHPDYSHSGKGEYYGGFEVPVSAETGLMDVVTDYLNRGKSRSDAIGAFMMNGELSQLPTSEWVKRNTQAITKNKDLIARYGSVPAALAAGETFADPVSDLRASEDQWDMTPEERAIADLRASEDGFMPTSDPQWKPARLPWLADTLGQLKGNKNYQNAEMVNPLASTVDALYNTAMGADNTLGDYIFTAAETVPVAAGASKGAMTLWDLLRGMK